jgi:hypothetical protein
MTQQGRQGSAKSYLEGVDDNERCSDCDDKYDEFTKYQVWNTDTELGYT